jgi:hypothetical protein
MPRGASEYERHQIESLLQTRDTPIDPGLGLFLAPDDERFRGIHDAAVAPAMHANGINQAEIVRVFGSDSLLSDVCWWAQRAEVIVADLSAMSPDVMFVLGLCCGLRRCPLIIAQPPIDLPFNLAALRCISYEPDNDGLGELREDLSRAMRVFLSAARAGR